MIGQTTDNKAPSRDAPKTGAPVKRLGDLLVERGVLSAEQLSTALERQREQGNRKLLGEVLLELSLATAEQITETLAEVYDVPFARVSPRIVDPRVMEVLPRDFIEKHGVLPMFLVNGRLTVAVHEPANVFLIEEIAEKAKAVVQVVAATAKDIRAALESHLPNANVFVLDELVEDLQSDSLEVVEQEVADLASAETSSDASPVIKLVNHVIFGAVESRASDIHIEPSDGPTRVRYRVDGKLFKKLDTPRTLQPAIVSRIKIMAGMDISERRIPLDGGITVMVRKQPIDLRVSTMPSRFGEKVVIRVIDNRNLATTLDHLGFGPDMLHGWRRVVKAPNGVVLVTGPTGSGKSTTLYGTLAEINDDELNVSTVEDPVEYQLPGVNQFQVHAKAGFTFAGALRALLRQDPDIIMVGEVRDPETAKMCTQAALTGHLVLSTLHTNDAPSAVTRLTNMGVEPFLVAAAVRGVLGQRLVRRICSSCKSNASLDDKQKRTLERFEEQTQVSLETPFEGEGCDRCRGTGYAGRVGVYELMTMEAELIELASREAGLQELKQAAMNNGYQPMLVDGMRKAKAGLTTIDELLTVATG